MKDEYLSVRIFQFQKCLFNHLMTQVTAILRELLRDGNHFLTKVNLLANIVRFYSGDH